jgi:hypothetical protein
MDSCYKNIRVIRESDLNKKQRSSYKGPHSRLHAASSIPLYIQLADAIRSDITTGEWKGGELIPPEKELGELYRVSRITGRNALAKLLEEGLIYRFLYSV